MNDAEQTPQDAEMKQKMKLYALYLKDLQTMGTRQEHIRKYYITLITAIFTILSLGGSTLMFSMTPALIVLVSIFGDLLCGVWLLHMISYRTLFEAKFRVLKDMENNGKLPFHPFTSETTEKAFSKSWHFQMTWIDIIIAALFIGLFITLPFLTRAAPAVPH